MKSSLLTHNWKAKLISLVIAFVIWYVIKHNTDHQRSPIDTIRSKAESKI